MIRERMVANLRVVDEALASRVADGLGMTLPAASRAAVPVVDLEPSPALSLLANAKETFEGRKLGLLVGDGADAASVRRLAKAIVTGAPGGAALADEPAVRDFLTDAFSHLKVIGLCGDTDVLVEATGLTGKLDDACLVVDTATRAAAFVARIAGSRQWQRDLTA